MSAIEITDTVSETQEVTMELNTVLAALKQLGCADLFKVMRTATTEAEKRSKTEAKKPKKEKQATPPQLKKPTAWVRYVLKWATENGWEEFVCQNKKSGEEIVMPASIEKDNEYVFPDGKKLILTQAMSLSKLLWQPKAKVGTNEALYRAFETEFATTVTEESSEVVVAPKAPLVRKTAAEKEAELKEKKEKAEQARNEKKAAKAAEKAAEKAAVPKAAVKTAAKKAVVTPVAVPVAAPVAGGVKPGPKKKAVPKKEEWSCPADGNVYPWEYKSVHYLRNAENQVWVADQDGGCGDWAGMFVPSEDRIDESVADPFADEEDEE